MHKGLLLATHLDPFQDWFTPHRGGLAKVVVLKNTSARIQGKKSCIIFGDWLFELVCLMRNVGDQGWHALAPLYHTATWLRIWPEIKAWALLQY